MSDLHIKSFDCELSGNRSKISCLAVVPELLPRWNFLLIIHSKQNDELVHLHKCVHSDIFSNSGKRRKFGIIVSVQSSTSLGQHSFARCTYENQVSV